MDIAMTQREKIIEKASQMFLKQGVKAVRMDDIAVELRISKRTLYEMFSDKEELMFLCTQYIYDSEMNELKSRTHDARNGMERLFMGVEVLFECMKEHSSLIMGIQKFYPETFERIRKIHMEKSFSQLRKFIISYIDDGLFEKKIDIELSVIIFYITVTEVLGQRGNISYLGSVSEKDVVMYMLIHFFRGISTLKGVQMIDEYLVEQEGKRKDISK